MTWTLIIFVMYGDMPAIQVVAPFGNEESCNAAAEKVTADYRKAVGKIYSFATSCVRK